MSEKIETTWDAWTYDVWGNARDGYEVNDRYRAGTHTLTLTVERHNVGTPQEFTSAHPTDTQLRALFGLGRTRITTDGDDLTIYLTRERDSYPLGEVHCTSHASLSPIRVSESSATA